MDKQKDEMIKLLKKFKKDVEKKIKLERFIFFGSRATGEARQASDFDLLLVSKDFKGKKYFKRSPAFYLLWKYKYDVDILCLTPEELLKKRRQVGVIRQAVKEGIAIK